MSDETKRQLAEQYQTMIGTSAWLHFYTHVLMRVKEQAIRDEDTVPMEEMSMARIAECRGRRTAVNKIVSDLDFIMHGLE